MNASKVFRAGDNPHGLLLALSRLFLFTAGALIAVAAIAKVWSAFGSSRLLTVPDPILRIQFRHLMVAAGFVELTIVVVCWFSRVTKIAIGLVAWLATNLLIYRLGLWWIDWHRPCNCLGNLTDALHISPTLADNIMKVVLAYLLVGSYGLLFCQWYYGRRMLRHQENTGVQGVEV